MNSNIRESYISVLEEVSKLLESRDFYHYLTEKTKGSVNKLNDDIQLSLDILNKDTPILKWDSYEDFKIKFEDLNTTEMNNSIIHNLSSLSSHLYSVGHKLEYAKKLKGYSNTLESLTDSFYIETKQNFNF